MKILRALPPHGLNFLGPLPAVRGFEGNFVVEKIGIFETLRREIFLPKATSFPVD